MDRRYRIVDAAVTAEPPLLRMARHTRVSLYHWTLAKSAARSIRALFMCTMKSRSATWHRVRYTHASSARVRRRRGANAPAAEKKYRKSRLRPTSATTSIAPQTPPALNNHCIIVPRT